MARTVVPRPDSRMGAVLGLAAATLCAPRVAASQVTPGVDVGVFSRYLWRGLTRRNAPVAQMDAYVAYRFRSLFVTAGAWTSLELSRADARIADALGLGARVGEVDTWYEVSHACQYFEGGLGFTTYSFIQQADAPAVGNTLFDAEELYARITVRVGPVAPRATVWYDWRQTKGAYAEVGASYRVPVFPLGIPVLRLGGLAGFSLGQEVNPRAPAERFYFARSGLTHVDVSAEAQLSLGIIGVNLYALPAVHVRINVDDATKRVRRGPNGASDLMVWGGMTLSLHGGR